MKGARRINNSGTVFTKDFFSQFSEIIRSKAGDYLNNVETDNKQGQAEDVKFAQEARAGLDAFKATLNNATEIVNEDLWSVSLSEENKYIMNAVMEQKPGEFNIQLNPDSSQPEFIIPVFNPGGPFTKKSKSAGTTPTQVVTLDDLNKIQEENVIDGKTRSVIMSEMQLLEKKGLDGDPWTPLLEDNILASNMEKWKDAKMGSLVFDSMIGTKKFADDFIDGSRVLNNIKLPYMHPADINSDGVLDQQELRSLSRPERKQIFGEYVKMAENDSTIREELQKEWAWWVTRVGQGAAHASGFKQSKKSQDTVSKFDFNNYI